MPNSNKYKINHIIASLVNGQFKQAKEETQKGCKTKPEKQGRKIGQVVGELMISDQPDLACRYLNLFDQ
jgi:nitrate reductase assembly molybdenum cofactor insertion protein NarJ